eukprot:gene6303-7467_t
MEQSKRCGFGIKNHFSAWLRSEPTFKTLHNQPSELKADSNIQDDKLTTLYTPSLTGKASQCNAQAFTANTITAPTTNTTITTATNTITTAAAGWWVPRVVGARRWGPGRHVNADRSRFLYVQDN